MVKSNDVVVLYIITKLELGGAQKVCLSLMEGVVENGLKAGLISGSQGELVSQIPKSKDVFLLDSFNREAGLRFFFKEIKTFFQILKVIGRLKREYPNLVVHTHSTKAGLIGRWAAFFSRIKVRVHTIHGFGFNEYQSKLKWYGIFFIEYLTSLITTHFVCVSEKDREFGVRMFPRFGQKSSIIRAAVEWNKFYTPAIKKKNVVCLPDDSFIIGTISCFKPQKNLFDLLKAFKILYADLSEENKVRVRLQIIGDGVLRGEIECWIKQNNLSEKIDLLGWHNDVAPWMHNWKVFALSSLWEGLPIAVVEARMCKLPVVAYDVGGIFEVIFNGKNGFLVPPTFFIQLAQRLKFLIENKDLCEEMSSYKDNLNDFKDGVMIDKHIQLYQRLSG
jgi:glycosyltransferase involved in cell wall biosynthesis